MSWEVRFMLKRMGDALTTVDVLLTMVDLTGGQPAPASAPSTFQPFWTL